MNAAIKAWALQGVEATPIEVTVDTLNRLPSIAMIGLPALSVREGAERVRSAIVASGFTFPRKRVIVALSPADLRKEGTGFDLAIAVAILKATGQLDVPDDVSFIGELTLGGEVRPVRGIVAATLAAGTTRVVCAAGSSHLVVEAGGTPIPIRTLGELPAALLLPHTHIVREELPPSQAALDFSDVRGQDAAIHQLVEASKTRRPVLLVGPPGCGKTMLAARAPGLLPDMTDEERREVLRNHEAAGLVSGDTKLSFMGRPFRAPHHTCSPAGLCGGALLRPGEVTLAHRGVLFLDEFTEFPRASREALRAPIEDKQVVLARAGGRTVMPADFWLIAACNPCPCGNLGHPTRPCVCGEAMLERYTARMEYGPLKDALRIHLSPTSPSKLFGPLGRTTQELRGKP